MLAVAAAAVATAAAQACPAASWRCVWGLAASLPCCAQGVPERACASRRPEIPQARPRARPAHGASCPPFLSRRSMPLAKKPATLEQLDIHKLAAYIKASVVPHVSAAAERNWALGCWAPVVD